MEHDQLTNARLKDKYDSQFELVNFAISLAKRIIYSGKTTHADVDVQNPAFQVLEDIADNKVMLDDLEKEESFERIELESTEVITDSNVSVG